MGELSLNPLLIVCKGLHLIGLSNHLSIGHRPSMALTSRYQDQMPLNTLVTYRFLLEQAQQVLDRALESACMKAIFAPL